MPNVFSQRATALNARMASAAMVLFALTTGYLLVLLWQQTPTAAAVDVWCGKPYRAGYALDSYVWVFRAITVASLICLVPIDVARSVLRILVVTNRSIPEVRLPRQ